jgi:hypothetical protein
MLKQTVAVLAIALAGTAGAAGWKDLRVDASSDEAFAKSLQTFYDELSPERRHVFSQALTDIWLKGTQDGQANQREYTVADYHAQLDGLSYEEVVTLTDPTGETAKQRYQDAKGVVAQRNAQVPGDPFNAGASDAFRGTTPAERDNTLVNQGRQASPSLSSAVPGLSTRPEGGGCGGNFGGCEQPGGSSFTQ